ncbi:MAG: hypothetical protein JNL30_17005 [Rubrivivax sp.]|nr:hypothetical protein [Rubrivivax sp.]
MLAHAAVLLGLDRTLEGPLARGGAAQVLRHAPGPSAAPAARVTWLRLVPQGGSGAAAAMAALAVPSVTSGRRPSSLARAGPGRVAPLARAGPELIDEQVAELPAVTTTGQTRAAGAAPADVPQAGAGVGLPVRLVGFGGTAAVSWGPRVLAATAAGPSPAPGHGVEPAVATMARHAWAEPQARAAQLRQIARSQLAEALSRQLERLDPLPPGGEGRCRLAGDEAAPLRCDHTEAEAALGDAAASVASLLKALAAFDPPGPQPGLAYSAGRFTPAFD